MLYLVVGWNGDKAEMWLWYAIFSHATSEYSTQVNSQVNSRRFTKVSIYKVDLKFLTITLMGEE